MENNTIFALDIGTRKIVGLLLRKNDEDDYEIIGSEMIEHTTRAMIDGQIHDVEAVASTILKIKKILEQRLDIKLKTAAVAAAGRALKTSIGSAIISRNIAGEFTADEIRALEIEAVHKAQYTLAQDNKEVDKNTTYFCVGYSVIRYSLEGQEIANLIGHIGREAKVDIVATFLPRVVVDSLLAALRKADLDIYSLTLEPIAAISVAIPQNMRLLNLALVDIGAGTSDIAIIKSGNIYAYAMVPFGGDELTEHIAREYLLDFDSAEAVKCLLGDNEEVQFTDIIGNEIAVKSSELINSLQENIRELTVNITAQILSLNQKSPDAVLCIGGGSLTPTFIDNLAETLGISRNRIGIRTRQTLKNIIGDFDFLNGPKGVTSLGIAFNSFKNPPVPFVKATVNDRATVLWNTGEIDVAAALLSSGISLNNIFGKPGMGKTIEINGYLKVFKGEMGTAPVIKVNDKNASLDTPVNNGDIIEFNKGENGKDAVIKVKDLTPGEKGYVFVNGEKVLLTPIVTVNGLMAGLEDDIPDRAKVEYQRNNTVKNILSKANVLPEFLQETVYRYYLNKQEMILRWVPVKVKVNNTEVRLEDTISFGTNIEYQLINENPTFSDILNIDNKSISIEVLVNGQKVTLEGQGVIVKADEQVVSLDHEMFNGANITVETSKTPAILSDIFKKVTIKPSTTGKLTLLVNGNPAGFTTPIANGSDIQIKWD